MTVKLPHTVRASTIFVASCFLAACITGPTDMKESSYADHFDGKRFYNVPNRQHAGTWPLIKWLVTRKLGPWDAPRSDIQPGPPPPAEVPLGSARVTFVNHSTVLIQIDGLNILTDPIYAERASPVSFAGPRRVRPPGIRFKDLPKIDVVLVSHNHYDHLCLETLKQLYERDRPAFYTGLGNRKLLEGEGIVGVNELDWWDGASLDENVSLTFVPAQHFSARGPFDRFETLWGGFYIAGTKHRIYFAGDTGAGPHFEDVRERLGSPDLALIPIGAYLPPHIMQPVHLSPEEAVAAHLQVGARQSMAIHFGTFPLADDGQREPVERLEQALSAEGLTRSDFWVLGFGEGRNLDP